jgi:flagellar hook-associated protein 1 FlgK
MSVSQAAVQVASHNIANANTPGYSRQREVLTANAPEHTPQGVFGTGVSMTTVQRARDGMLDQQFRDGAAQSAGYSTRSESLQRIENVFGEPSETGLAFALDQFQNAWSELSANPSNASAKMVVQQRGQALASTFNNIANSIDSLKSETVTRAQAFVDDINRIASQIADLNKQIVPMESGGNTASDLRDQRDVLLDQLSKVASVRVIENSDGSNNVLLGTLSLVDGNSSKQVTLTAGSTMSVTIAGSTDALRNIGGSLGALQGVYNTDIPTVRTSLDTLARAVVTDVNAVHRTGWTAAAGTNVDFFDATPGNDTAGRIRLSATIAGNANAVAAGSIVNEPGDNSVALAMSALRDAAPSSTGGTFGADLRAVVGNVASQLNQAKNSSTVYDTLAQQSDQRRTSVFGVSVDEELIQIMRQQQSYAAASRIVKTVDEMMQTLLSLK